VRHLAAPLIRLVTVLFAVTALSFLLLNLLPGDPTIAILGPAAGDPAAHEQLRKELHLDQSVPQRYVHWLGRALHGDLGQSYSTNQSVASAIGQRLPLTLELVILAELLALAIAIPLGVFAARRPNGWFDRLTGTSTFALLAMPSFMLGVLLVYLFAVKWNMFPATGTGTWFHIGNGVVGTPGSLTLPIITLAAGQLAVFGRLLRTDFILASRSKGIPQWRILFFHALRPSSFTLLTVLGITAAGLVGGSIIVEQLFALPGMGSLLVQSILKRDYLVVQGCVVLISAAFVLFNFFVDLVYAVLDPRIRYGTVSA
jgi:peptide/nickel transport system permease protein